MSKEQAEVHHANADSGKYFVPNGSDLPEVYDHAYPEVVPESYPEHIDTSAPEVLHPPVRDQKEVVADTPKERTVCGLRRKTFWIVLAIVLVVVVAGAVGGGVGGALANKNSNGASDGGASNGPSSTSSSGEGDDSSSPSSNTSSAAAAALLPNTRLASINYTDADGTQHHHVYYQLASKHIRGSAWNSSSQTWHTFAVTTGDADGIANNTPISASLYRHSASRHDFRIYWLTAPANAVAGVIANNEPLGPYASSAVAAEGFVAGAGSGLASYGRACADCPDTNALAWRDGAGALQFAVNSDGWVRTEVPTAAGSGVANGSDAVLGAVWEEGATRYLSLYYVAGGGGNVTRLLWSGGSDWEGGGGLGAGALPARVDVDAPRIAAFESGYNDTAGFAARVVGAAAGSGGGVELAAWDGGADGEWTLSTTETSGSGDGRPGLESIAAGSSLAANQAGRVYGFVANGSLGEWVWSRADGFTFAGWVNTTAG